MVTSLTVANLCGQIIATSARMSDLAGKMLDAVTAAGSGMANYSQRDPSWRNDVFAGGLRFETDGCYVCAVADVLSLAGYNDRPPEVAEKLRDAKCFNGAYLSWPDQIPVAYPKTLYYGTLGPRRN
jgi:hypothetical protein